MANENYQPFRMTSELSLRVDDLAERVPCNKSWLIRQLISVGVDLTTVSELKKRAKKDPLSGVRNKRPKL